MIPAIAAAVALTRLLAISRSLWDWDEALFCSSLRGYDVAAHHPHPPGFPLYVAAAKLVHVLVASEFRSLQVVNVAAALLVFPLCYFMARSMRFAEPVAIGAALLFSFLPNVWFYGGTAFSDLPALVIVTGAAGALFAGRDDRRWYFVGCLLFGAAMTFRPQNLIIGAWPWFVAAWDRWRMRRSDVAIGALLAALVVAIGYGGAAAVTGVHNYVAAVDAHGQYVVKVDSYHNPNRPPVGKLFYQYAIDPYDAGTVAVVMSWLIAIGLIGAIVRRERAVAHALLTFGPFFVFALFMLNPMQTGRLSLGYIPLIALLTAYGAATVGRLLAFGRPRITAVATFVILLAITGTLIRWTLPGLRQVRRHDSPPVAALMWAAQHVPASAWIYVHPGYGPQADYLLAGRRNVEVIPDENRLTRLPASAQAWYVSDGVENAADAVHFSRPRRPLYSVFLHRYFEASVVPLTDEIEFGAGWYGEEGAGEVWRWMGKRSVLKLPPVPGKGDVSLTFYVPLDAEPPPVVQFTMNGTPLDRVTANTANWTWQFVAPSRADAPNELVIEVDHTIQPNGDPRTLGLRLSSWSWKAHSP